MQYTLITGNGKVLTFFIKAVAEMYQKAYSGIIITNDIVLQEDTENVD
jgi:Ni2+-binding GTPase involved in maturation of urease and hydrogenase